jgi:hypothetical protein
MRNLWVKIGLGAGGVFVVGMMGLTLARNARAAALDAFHRAVDRAPAAAAEGVETAVEAADASAEADATPATGIDRFAALAQLRQVGGGADFGVDIPFRLDGVDLGLLTRGSIRRVRADALPVMTIEVELTEADARARLEDCVLVPMRHRDSDFGGGFRCASSDDRDLVTFGTVRFTPGRFSRPLMITSAQAADMRRGEPFEARANLQGGVHVEANGGRGEQVRLQADERGANIRIHDEHGNDIFRLLADSLGASLRVKGKDGRDIVRFSAGNGQLSLTVDTAGH